MSHLKNVTNALQGVVVDIVTGYKMIQTVKDTLQVVSFMELKVHAWWYIRGKNIYISFKYKKIFFYKAFVKCINQ